MALLLALACGDDPARLDEPVPGALRAPAAATEHRGQGELPSTFPEDVPLYTDARTVSSLADPAHGTVVHLRTPDDPERVFAWYRAAYPERGWAIEQERSDAGRRIVVAGKAGRVSSVVISSAEAGSELLVTVAADAPAP